MANVRRILLHRASPFMSKIAANPHTQRGAGDHYRPADIGATLAKGQDYADLSQVPIAPEQGKRLRAETTSA